jgi:hypothetical protein
MGDKRGAYRLLVGKQEWRPLRRSGVNGRIILKGIFEKWNETRTGSIWFRLGTGGWLL